jgi:hypothetical protein
MSNHLGDTNKMVDTPRTEAEVNRQKCWSDDLVTIDANFACQLERELNAANDRIKRLEEENNELRAAEARLLNTNGELERRIHRAGMAFFRDGSDGHVASQMLAILEERGKP